MCNQYPSPNTCRPTTNSCFDLQIGSFAALKSSSFLEVYLERQAIPSKIWCLVCIFILFVPSRELTYPLPMALLKMIFLFPRWDMLVRSLEGIYFGCTSWGWLESPMQFNLWKEFKMKATVPTFGALHAAHRAHINMSWQDSLLYMM